ncbi:hypothetical protein [Bradyrhizobium sp. AUGA SZCCT0431]|nr:hypothetical protein [Bradyrhizobium sp. AUGA SZCCT0431]MBR1148008.1 hypothetical protein [Bradyrhizobium sp. AUGA SZCCT0431]
MRNPLAFFDGLSRRQFLRHLDMVSQRWKGLARMIILQLPLTNSAP